MTQIQNQNPLLGSSSLNGLGAAANAASTNAARKDGVPAFAQWLNQSNQQLQTQQQNQQLQNQQLQAQQLQSQQQAQQLQNQQLQNQQAQQQAQNARDNAPKAPEPQREPESTAAQDETKLAARNAAARGNASKAENGKASTAPSRARQADGADKTDAADAKDAADAAAGADTEGAERVQSADGEGKDQKVAKESKDAKEATATPGEQILAMLRGESPTEAKTKARGDADGTEADAAGDALPGGPQTHGKHQPSTGDALRERQQLQRELSQAAAGKDAGAKDEALQAVSGQGAHEIALGDGKSAAPGAPQSFDAMLAAAQQTGAATGTAGSSTTGRAEAPSVPLSQPLHSPDFAPELSASVSLLLKDGIHEAQLQLNPTEMGPVSINIQLDGQQAQVNFHAQQAATREVLERSLPDLAAALQAQGLTLSGGGVFAQQQSGGSQNQRDGSASGSSGGNGRRGGSGQDDDGIAATGRAERRTPARGLVDLYA